MTQMKCFTPRIAAAVLTGIVILSPLCATIRSYAVRDLFVMCRSRFFSFELNYRMFAHTKSAALWMPNRAHLVMKN